MKRNLEFRSKLKIWKNKNKKVRIWEFGNFSLIDMESGLVTHMTQLETVLMYAYLSIYIPISYLYNHTHTLFNQ